MFSISTDLMQSDMETPKVIMTWPLRLPGNWPSMVKRGWSLRGIDWAAAGRARVTSVRKASKWRMGKARVPGEVEARPLRRLAGLRLDGFPVGLLRALPVVL